jgi:hypothetical protein
MRNTEHFKKHLSISTEIDGKRTSQVYVEDPFHTTTVTIGWSFLDWFKMIFQKKECVVRVKVHSNGVSQGRWFRGADICEHCKSARIDLPGQHESKPGYEHGDERWCEDC